MPVSFIWLLVSVIQHREETLILSTVILFCSSIVVGVHAQLFVHYSTVLVHIFPNGPGLQKYFSCLSCLLLVSSSVSIKWSLSGQPEDSLWQPRVLCYADEQYWGVTEVQPILSMASNEKVVLGRLPKIWHLPKVIVDDESNLISTS